MIFVFLILLIVPMNKCDPESATESPIEMNSTNSTRGRLLFTGDDQKRTDLGVNLGPIDYSMPQWVFTNKFKHAKEFLPVYSDDLWASYRFAGSFNTTWDLNGYPSEFAYADGGRRYGYHTVIGTSGLYPTGDYVLRFNGTGEVKLFGDATQIQILGSNQLAFSVLTATTTGIIIVINKPDVFDVDLRISSDIGYEGTFSREYLEVVENFKAIRFSPWMVKRRGNIVSNGGWLTRRPVNFYTQVGQKMVSLEYILELANIVKKPIWLSMPETASSELIQNMAEFFRDNLRNVSEIYLEESTDIGWQQNNQTATMLAVTTWKDVFANITEIQLKCVLTSSDPLFFDQTLTYFTDDELSMFDAFAVPVKLGRRLPFLGNDFDVLSTVNMTENDIADVVQQEIYKDEIDLIHLIQRVLYKLNKPLFGYDCGFRVRAPGYGNRFFQKQFQNEEQRLEDLIISTWSLMAVQDMYLDFIMRWYKMGGGILFMENIVDMVNRCPEGGAYCGQNSLLASLLEAPRQTPRYSACLKWLDGMNATAPFTSADLPKVSKSQCSPVCEWGTCFNGTCVCYDGYTGTTCSTLVKKYLSCSSNRTQFGVNLGGMSDWSTEQILKDIHKRARQWIVQKIVYSNTWGDWNQSDVQLRESDGYPKYLERQKTVGTFLTRDVHAHFPNGKYVLLYDGDGVLNFRFKDTVVTRRSAGRIEVDVTHKLEFNNGIYYDIIRTNPSNPVRNVRMFEARFENSFEEFPFHPLFIETIKKFQVIRFMTVSNVFHDWDVDWSDRTTNDYYTYTLRTGMSLEHQVLLANTVGANPWFNIPHRASDLYITNWATFIRDNLRPDVTIYVEQGNECWAAGDAHPCGTYATTMGTRTNISLIKNNTRADYFTRWNPDVVARICYHAKIGHQYAQLIRGIFGDAASRIKFVINMQAAWMGPLEVFFLCEGEYYRSFDVVGIAPYLSASMENPDGSLMDLEQFYNGSTVADAIARSLRQLNTTLGHVKESAPHMTVGLYEAGPDFSSLHEQGNLKLTNLSLFIHRDRRMYQALTDYISNMTRSEGVNLDLYVHYQSVGTYTKYGCWGLLESSDQRWQDSPKYSAYVDFIDGQAVCDWLDSEQSCPSDCNGSGKCSTASLPSGRKDMCYCDFGSSGPACETSYYMINQDCSYECGGKGNCSFDRYEGFYEIHTCHCELGYYGYGCTLFNCTGECSYSGECVDSEQCACYRGFKGDKCQVDCGCAGHGICSPDSPQSELCICDRGYTYVNGSCTADCSVSASQPECAPKCSSCGMGTCVRGHCVCWAGYTHDAFKSCSIKTNAPNDGSKLGVNMNGVSYWSSAWTFVDLSKQAGPWIMQHCDGLDTLYIWNTEEELLLTRERYPAQLAYNRQAVTLMLRDVKNSWPDSIYHVTYDGEGTLAFGFDATLVEATAGQKDKNRMKIRAKLTQIRDNGVFMKLKRTNPLNPVRNIRLVKDGFEDIFMDMPFHPLFVQRLAKFKTIRYMNWIEQEGVVDWTDRITPTTFSQGQGVAFEYMIKLSNMLKANPWVIVPYAANDNYVTEMAKLFKATLRKDVQIQLEYTNEGWNPAFKAGVYCEMMGKQLGLSDDPMTARNLYVSRRSQQIIKIWKSVFGSAEDYRISLVLPSFLVMPVVSTRILSFENAYKSHTNIMLAVVGYFDCGSPSALSVALDDLAVTFQRCEDDLANVENLVSAHAEIARQFKVGLGMYESGSSLVEYKAMMTGIETPGATDKYIAVNRDSRMYQIYMNYYRMFDKYNLTENCHYCYVALPSKYGSWELMDTQDQDIATAHRYRAIMELIDETRLTYTNYTDDVTCFGVAFNASDVCASKGVCVGHDECEPFSKPSASSPILILPTQGVSLVTAFHISTEPWISRFRLVYAFGISLPAGGFKQLTANYSSSTSLMTILPYVGPKPYKIVVFAKDPFGTVYTAVSNQLVSVTELSAAQNVSTVIANFSQNEKLIALLDKSAGISSTISSQVLDSIDIAVGDVDSLHNLEGISSSFAAEPQVVNNIKSKVNDLLTGSLNNNSTTLSNTAIQSVVNIVSTIYTADTSTKDKSLINSLAQLLVNSGSEQTLDANADSLPEVTFASPSFKISVSTFNANSLQRKYVKQSSFLSVDLSAVFKGNGSQKASVTTIKYAADTSLSSVGFEKIDIKFFSADTMMNVLGLSEPLILQFSFDPSSSGSLRGSAVACKYYDEVTGEWSTEGCELASIDYVNGTVFCECTHTTLFSVASVSNSISEEAEPKNSATGIKIRELSWAWCLIVALFDVFLYKDYILAFF